MKKFSNIPRIHILLIFVNHKFHKIKLQHFAPCKQKHQTEKFPFEIPMLCILVLIISSEKPANVNRLKCMEIPNESHVGRRWETFLLISMKIILNFSANFHPLQTHLISFNHHVQFKMMKRIF